MLADVPEVEGIQVSVIFTGSARIMCSGRKWSLLRDNMSLATHSEHTALYIVTNGVFQILALASFDQDAKLTCFFTGLKELDVEDVWTPSSFTN
jgi:hypothetical protein